MFTKLSPAKDEIEGNGDDNRYGKSTEPGDAELGSQELHRSSGEGGDDTPDIGFPENGHQIIHHVDDAESNQHRTVQSVANTRQLQQWRECHFVNHQTDEEHHNNHQRDGEIGVQPVPGKKPIADISPQDDESSMSDVEEFHDPHQQTESEGDQTVHGSHQDSVCNRLSEHFHPLFRFSLQVDTQVGFHEAAVSLQQFGVAFHDNTSMFNDISTVGN